MLDPSFEELRASGKLPSPPGVGLEVLRITRDEEFELAELVGVLRADPALTGRILQLANGAMAGGAESATTLEQACLRLGQRAVRNVALGFTLVSSLQSGPCRAFDYDRFWAESLVRGLVCQDLASQLRLGDPAEAFVCGLLSQVGTLALATVHPKTFAEILIAHEQRNFAARREAEWKAFGIDHLEVSAALLSEWGLPRIWQDAVRRIGMSVASMPAIDLRSQGLPELLWVSARFGAAFGLGLDRPLALEEVQRVLGKFQRWDHEKLPELWERVRDECRRWATLLELHVREVPFYLSRPNEEEVEGPLYVETAVGGGSEQALRSHVLVVDDDPMSLRMVAHALVREGLRVTTARHGREALRLALEEPPDVLIADWMMPEMSGLELCEALRDTDVGRKMYIVLLTSKNEEDQVVRAFEAGVDDYVVKPFKPKLLLARVRAGQRVVRLQRQVDQDQQVMRQQVAELGVLARKLRQASLTDMLTELPNRRWAIEHLEREWERGCESRTGIAAIAVDVDHFKSVNDRFGHDVGDCVLRATASALRSALGEEAQVARMGGEEFLVLLPGRGLVEACAIGELLRRAVAERTIECGEFRGNITASFGVAFEQPEPGRRPDDLLKLADEALYRAKAAGRDCVQGSESAPQRS
ncbi:MAG: HDOD domain-containing protein [Planctomycetes bacterium]|nr:HDOD domain-containing protein [Planctomycetota bacterium]